MLLGLEPYRATLTAYSPALAFVSRTESLSRTRRWFCKPRPIQGGCSSLFGAIYPLLILLALGLVGAVLAKGDRRKQLGWCAVLVLFGLLYNAISCLEVAIINSLEIRRYMTVQLFPAIFAQFLALWFVLEFFLERRAERKFPLQ